MKIFDQTNQYNNLQYVGQTAINTIEIPGSASNKCLFTGTHYVLISIDWMERKVEVAIQILKR